MCVVHHRRWRCARRQGTLVRELTGDVALIAEASGMEILRLMAGAAASLQMPKRWKRPKERAKSDASSILSKLGVRDRTRAVLKALELGWI